LIFAANMATGWRRLIVRDVAKLPEAAFITKVPGRFPADCGAFVAGWREQTDCVLAYSILPVCSRTGISLISLTPRSVSGSGRRMSVG
jgi:hypothetical protein